MIELAHSSPVCASDVPATESAPADLDHQRETGLILGAIEFARVLAINTGTPAIRFLTGPARMHWDANCSKVARVRKFYHKSESYRRKQIASKGMYAKTPKGRLIKRKAHRKWLRASPVRMLRQNISCRLSASLKHRRPMGISGYERIIGCTFDALMAHLQKQFSAGMTWRNYGQWHLDHIKPVVSFNLEDENDLCACFHFTNLQPLWARDNLSKGARWHTPA